MRAAIVSTGKKNIFRDNNGYKKRLGPPVPKQRQFSDLLNLCLNCSNPNASKTDLLWVVISFLTVHLGGGLWGVLSAPIFNKESGIFVKGNELAFRAFGWNLLGVLVIMAWSAAWAIILFFALHLFKQLRVSEEIELKGKYLQYF